jgi:hypothetical protein
VPWRDEKAAAGAGLSGVKNRLGLTLFFGPSKAPSAFGTYYTRKEGGRQGLGPRITGLEPRMDTDGHGL